MPDYCKSTMLCQVFLNQSFEMGHLEDEGDFSVVYLYA